MKPKDLTTVALRVLAVFVASQAFVYLAEAATFLAVPPENRSGPPLSALAGAWLVAPSIAALAIWIAAPYLSRLATRGIDPEPITRVDVNTISNIALTIAGIVIFLLALPGLVVNIGRAFGPPGTFAAWWLVASALKLLLGLALIVGSQNISRFLLRLRYAG
ncbi:MAG TPA: hypothetical protein VFM97_01605, partial [Gammaproteobacteria bacterium]|nr:hypothetical protein [Gammaproteobacteria bacterium]